MSLPRFAAEAALYRTKQVYRGYRGTTGGDEGRGVVPTQICGTDCWAACVSLQGGLCSIPCAIAIATCNGPWCAITLAFCLIACGGQVVDCILGCPSCHDGGGGGGGGVVDCTTKGCARGQFCCRCPAPGTSTCLSDNPTGYAICRHRGCEV